MSNSEKVKRNHLSPKIKIIWSLNYIVGFIILILLLILFSPYLEDMFNIKLYNILFYVIIGLIILFVPLFIYIELKYRNYVFYFTNKMITIEKGIFYKTKYVIPYEKIQNANIEYTLLYKLFDVGRVVIETAGTNLRESEITIEAVDKPEVLLNLIMKKVREEEEELIELPENKLYEKLIKSIITRLDKLENRINKLEKEKGLKKKSTKKKKR